MEALRFAAPGGVLIGENLMQASPRDGLECGLAARIRQDRDRRGSDRSLLAGEDGKAAFGLAGHREPHWCLSGQRAGDVEQFHRLAALNAGRATKPPRPLPPAASTP